MGTCLALALRLPCRGRHRIRALSGEEGEKDDKRRHRCIDQAGHSAIRKDSRYEHATNLGFQRKLPSH
jgi:hypothetical protein